jgi:hypothetical protein
MIADVSGKKSNIKKNVNPPIIDKNQNIKRQSITKNNTINIYTYNQ